MIACACLGPTRGEPYCHCQMISRGLPRTPYTPEELKDMEENREKLRKIFDMKEAKHKERND